jgi:DNA-binding transcriptional LysR family regulator
MPFLHMLPDVGMNYTFNRPLLDGTSPARLKELGAIAPRIKDYDSWYAVWLEVAKKAEAEKRWLDAASYYHGAEFYLPALQAGTVDVYCFQTAIESFVAPVLHRFHVQYPNVSFNVKVSSTDETIEALNSGVAVIGLILNPPVRDTIASTQVFRDTIVVAVAPAHPLAGRKIVSLRELVAYPFVLTEKSFGLRQQIDQTFDRHALEPEISCVTNSLALVKELAGIGRRCALLPRCAIQREVAAGTLCSIAVKEFAAEPWSFCVSTLKDRALSPAAKTFVTAVIDYCRRYRR